MRYAQLREFDVANGEGVRVTIFMSGCEHYCKNCFNQDYWNFNEGRVITLNTLNTIRKYLDKPYIKGLSILGGEPLHPKNVVAVASMIAYVRYHFGYTKDIWLWSGYTYEELLNRECSNTKYVLSRLDVLVDGKFEESKKNLNLKFRGSSNQRVIDMNATNKEGSIQLYNL